MVNLASHKQLARLDYGQISSYRDQLSSLPSSKRRFDCGTPTHVPFTPQIAIPTVLSSPHVLSPFGHCYYLRHQAQLPSFLQHPTRFPAAHPMDDSILCMGLMQARGTRVPSASFSPLADQPASPLPLSVRATQIRSTASLDGSTVESPLLPKESMPQRNDEVARAQGHYTLPHAWVRGQGLASGCWGLIAILACVV